MWIWLLVALGVVILDQATKWLMVSVVNLPEIKTIPVIEGFFHITYVENTGAAFGMFGEGDQRWIFMVLSVIGIAALIIYLWKFRPKSKLVCASVAMIAGGGIGNMIDRCFRVNAAGRNFVVDFIDFRGIWDYVFNVADSFVCVGAGIIMVWCVYSMVVESKQKKKKAEAAEIAEKAANDENANAEKEKRSAENTDGEDK